MILPLTFFGPPPACCRRGADPRPIRSAPGRGRGPCRLALALIGTVQLLLTGRNR